MVESVTERKEKMIAALWANSNYDDDKGSRQKALQEIEANFETWISEFTHGTLTPAEEEVEDTYGFFEAGKRGEEKIHSRVPLSNETRMSDVIQADIDQ